MLVPWLSLVQQWVGESGATKHKKQQKQQKKITQQLP